MYDLTLISDVNVGSSVFVCFSCRCSLVFLKDSITFLLPDFFNCIGDFVDCFEEDLSSSEEQGQ